MRIDPRTRIGHVHYTVRDMDGQIDFYCRVLGFQLLWRDGNAAALGVASPGATQADSLHRGTELLRLTADPAARRYHDTAGLYHTAFLVPTRWDLAHLVRQIMETRTPVQGHSNHGTHLAIYLPDAEGNGIELAWDFPREEWPMANGQMQWERMPREGVDIDALLQELERDRSPWTGLRPGTTVGHIHLHVADLAATRRFYHELLGFDVTLDAPGMGALFMSAGGYHHHIGSNIWKGRGVPPAPPDALGLRYFTVLLPDVELLESLVARANQRGVPVTPHAEGALLRDPSGHGVLLAVDPATSR